jgi:hypothetical protein
LAIFTYLNLCLHGLLVTIFQLNKGAYLNVPTDDIRCNETSSIPTCDPFHLAVEFLFGGVLACQTVNFSNFECISIVAGGKCIIVEFLLDFDVTEIIWGIFGILDELPNPTNLSVLVRVIALHVHVNLLGGKQIDALVLGPSKE